MGAKKSKVYVLKMETANDVIFYDEEGRFHNHSKNSGSVHYRCEFGHEWTSQPAPCWCGWKFEGSTNG
jgi:hypothetical protein